MSAEASHERKMLSMDDGHFPGSNDLICRLRTFEWNGDAILDACSVHADYGHLLALTNDGSLHGIDLGTGASVRLCCVELPDIPPGRDDGHFGPAQHRLHASPDGAYAAIVVDRGRDGIVVRTRTGDVSMRLDGGDYFDETVPFSACFLRHEGRDVLVYRTAWNRLDAADPATGSSLTSRDIASYEAKGERPMHYLDYFHGQLLASPDGSLIFDDGWVWHPISIPRVWSVTSWLESNPWESEDGESIVDLARRDDWTKPACWISERHLALWDLADWNEDEREETGHRPGVRILDVTGRKALPDAWPMESQSERVLDLFSDGERLYVVDDIGTTAWDIASRAKLSRFAGFTARSLNQTRKSLVTHSDFEIKELRLLWPGGSDGRR